MIPPFDPFDGASPEAFRQLFHLTREDMLRNRFTPPTPEDLLGIPPPSIMGIPIRPLSPMEIENLRLDQELRDHTGDAIGYLVGPGGAVPLRRQPMMPPPKGSHPMPMPDRIVLGITPAGIMPQLPPLRRRRRWIGEQVDEDLDRVFLGMCGITYPEEGLP